MKLNDYQMAALKTATYKHEDRVIYPTLGLNGEAGEVADKIKKILRDTDVKRNEEGAIIIPEDKKEDIVKEVGDVLWYVAVLASDLGVDLEEVAQKNIDKLMSRMERGKLCGSGDNR